MGASVALTIAIARQKARPEWNSFIVIAFEEGMDLTRAVVLNKTDGSFLSKKKVFVCLFAALTICFSDHATFVDD